MDRMARPAGRARTPRRWRGPRRRCTPRSPIARTCSGSRPSSGPTRGAWPGRSRVFGDLPFMISATARRVGAPARVPLRRDDRRAAGCVQRDGQDWGLPPWRWDVMREDDFAWMRAARAALRGALRRLPDRSPRRPLSHLHPAARQERARVLRSRRRSRHRPRSARRCVEAATRSGLADALDVICRGPRLDAAVRARSRWRGSTCPGSRCCAGSGTGIATASRRSIRRRSPSCRSPPPARTTSSRWPHARRATPTSNVPSITRSRCCRRARALTLIPLQDVFGWTDRINTPAVVDEVNWTWRLPWPVDTWLDSRGHRGARRAVARRWTRGNGR